MINDLDGIVDTSIKFNKMKTWTKTIRKLEQKRSFEKQNLRMSKDYSNLGCTDKFTLIKKSLCEINSLTVRIKNLHNILKKAWNSLGYEDKCRYRYWINKEPFPTDLFNQWKNSKSKLRFDEWLDPKTNDPKKVIEEFDDKLTVIGNADFNTAQNSTELKVEMRLTRREAEKIANKIIHFLAISDAAELILDLHDED